MDKKKHLIILGLAVFLALIVTLLAYNWIQKTAASKSKTYQMQQVAIAAYDLPWSTVLTKDMVRTGTFLKESLPNGYYQNINQVIGRTLIQPVSANEPIIEARLAPTSITSGGVAAIITMKKRAMSVHVDKVVGVSGYIRPGNRVDVMVTLTPQEQNSTPITKTVLENVLVLAVGPEFNEQNKKEGGKQSLVDVITMEVTPEEGEKLALAASQGKLQLALRNAGDTEEVLTRGAKIPHLLKSYSGGAPVEIAPKVVYKPVAQRVRKARPVVAAAQPRPTTFTIELIKGSKVSEQKFEKGE